MTDHRLRGYGVLVGGLALLVLVVAAHGIAVPDGTGGEPQVEIVGSEDGRLLVEPVANESRLWPYTSTNRAVEGRTLGINVLVYGDHDRVEARFRSGRALDWEDEPFEEGDFNETGVLRETVRSVLWREAHGSDRYVYVESGGTGEWLPESYQLVQGTYLGERTHIRAYESPNPGEEWVAMQAHDEYFDYFRLRHTVTSTNRAQRRAESEFLDDDRVTVSQAFLDNASGFDSDGWVTVIEFVAALSVAGLAGPALAVRWAVRGRIADRLGPLARYRLREGLLAAAVVFLYVGVRVVGVVLEGQFPGTDPQLLAGVLYPVLAGGLPIAAAVLARPLEVDDAFLAATGAVGVAALLDFAQVGITAIPRHILLHRVLLAISLGLIAASAAFRAQSGRRLNQLLVYGVTGWVTGLLLTLLGFL